MSGGLKQVHEYLRVIEGDTEKEQELREILCRAVESIKEAAPDAFFDTVYKLHCVAYGAHFDEETAKKAVAEMRNTSDGSLGCHWTLEQASSLAAQHKIKNKYDMYYVLNMLYSDFSGVLGEDSGTYAKLAKAYINDIDAPEGKPFSIWFFMHKAKELNS